MKFSKKYIIAICLLGTCLLTLGGCSQKKATAYQQYVQNVLDVNYKGIFTSYVNDNNGNETDAVNMYEDCAANLSEQLINHYNLNTNKSIDVNTTFTDVAKDIYAAAKYEVSESYKENGDYYVDVTVYPIDILEQSYDDIMSYIETFNTDIANGVYNDYTEEEYGNTFALGISSILTEQSKDMSYKEPVVIKALIEDDGEYYSIAKDSLADIDEAMIAVESSATTDDTASDVETD
jgi:hypothetical protein